MEVWQALLLGIVQGLTEFLPISSSGHLVLVQAILKLPQTMVISFDIVVHLGTLVAVIAYFRRDLQRLIQGLLKWEQPAIKLAWFLILGTIPAVIFGLLAKDYLEKLFGDAAATGWQLLANGVILIIADRLSGRRQETQMNSLDVILIGLGQAAAIIPGISRSGATMAVGMGRKLTRQAAAKFSFLLAIPAILGAGLLDLKHLFGGSYATIGAAAFWLGIISAAISGYLVIKFFLDYLGRGTLRFFGYYCLFIGAVMVVWFSQGLMFR